MKVDSNTRGYTYWFMFKVSEFRVGRTYRFNILNFTRDLAKFYSKGMNLVTKVEKKLPSTAEKQHEEEDKEPTDETQWRYGRCKHVEFHSQGDVPRNVKKNPQTGENINTRYFSKLSFAYTFKEEDRGGKVVFAYAVPYGYTDLLVDLEKVKLNLMRDENFVEYEDLTKGDNGEQKNVEKDDLISNQSPLKLHDTDPVSPSPLHVQGQG